MQKFVSIIALAASCLATSALAQTDKAPATDCPAQYELIAGTLCMKSTDGHVVLPTSPVPVERLTDANCRSGYEITAGNLCMNPKTGNIVFAEKLPSNVTQTAKK